MRKLLMFTALSLLAGQALAKDMSKTTFSPEPVDATRAAIQRGFELAHNDDPAGAAAAYTQAIQSPGFTNLPEDMRYQTLLADGELIDSQGDHDKAHALLVRASESTETLSRAWHARLAAAFAMEDYRDSGYCVTSIAQRWPSTLEDINASAIATIDMHLREDKLQTGQRQALLQALFDAGWSDEEDDPDPLWVDLSRMLLAEDKVEQATTVATRIRSARAVLAMRADKRFDRITQGHLEQFDVDRLAQEQLAAAKIRAAELPYLLQPQVAVQGLLLDTRRYDEAIAIGDSIIAQVKGRDGTKIYDDFDDQFIWVLDQRSRALGHLGRWDQAVKQLSEAAHRQEGGVANVSQVLNLGQLEVYLKRPKDALRVVSTLGPMSPYGRMQLEMVQFLAAIQLQDKAAQAKHLAFMRAHRTDAISTWQDMLLLGGDMEGATSLLVERLQNEEWRTYALIEMQQYHDEGLAPLDVERMALWRQLLAQPEVVKALDKVGRIERVELQSPSS